MLLTLDVGNTNTVLGLYALNNAGGAASAPARSGEGSGDRSGGADVTSGLVAHWRVTTHKTQTADEYGVLFLQLFAMHKLEVSAVKAIIVSSVVPPLDSTLRRVCERYFQITPMFVEPGIKTGMPLLIDNPAELGADRLVNGGAAFARFGGPFFFVGFGPPP